MIILLYGDETFRLSEKVSEIKNKFLSNNKSGSHPIIIDFQKKMPAPDFSEVAEAFESQGLFSLKQLVILKNVFQNGSKEMSEKIAGYFEKNRHLVSNREAVIVFQEESFPQAKNKLFVFLLKNSKKQKFESLSDTGLSRWITERLKLANSQISISPAALGQLIAYVGADLFHLNNEIEKLAAFKKSGVIGTGDIENLVNAKVDANIFKTIEAISSGEKKKALCCLHDQLKSGADPFYIFSMYVFQFRNLLKVCEFYQREGSNNRYEIAQKTGLHPYVVEKALTQLGNFTLEKLKKIYWGLMRIDSQVKTGKKDLVLALDMLIADI